MAFASRFTEIFGEHWSGASSVPSHNALKYIEGQLVLVKVCDSGKPKSSTTMHLCCHSDFIIPQIKSAMQEIWSIEPQFLLIIQVYWNSLLG